MAALHDDTVELAEELRPLGEEAAEPRPAQRRNVTGLVAVGLGLAAAATYVLAPGESKLGAVAIQGLQGKSSSPGKKLVVEEDMGSYISTETVDLHHGKLGASLGDSAAHIFEDVVQKSNIDSELTSAELRAYKYRFISSMVGMSETNRGVHDYLERARKHINGDKPAMSKAFAEKVNAAGHSFRVEAKEWMVEESLDSFSSRLIKIPYEFSSESKGQKFEESMPKGTHGLGDGEVPASFDSAANWPACGSVINNPHNQGRCGSCWVFGAMGSLDSRMCIATDGAFSGDNADLSRGFGASCVKEFMGQDADGCQGGWPHWVFDYINENPGIPSTNCVPYFGGQDFADHWTQSMPAPACPSQCDSRHPRSMADDFFKPKGLVPYSVVERPDGHGIENLKQAIFAEGPLAYAFKASQAFMGYKEGVFSQGCHSNPNHAVQAIGWGTEPASGWSSAHEFILSLNSWGADWGLNGQFKVKPCVIRHFVIPGTMEAASYPLPIPNWN